MRAAAAANAAEQRKHTRIAGIVAVALAEPGAFELSVRMAAISAGHETDTRNGHH